jgi:hypothetical protein
MQEAKCWMMKAGALEQVEHRDCLTLKRGSTTNRPTNAAADRYSSQTGQAEKETISASMTSLAIAAARSNFFLVSLVFQQILFNI